MIALIAAITILGSGRLGPTLTALIGLTAAALATRDSIVARRAETPGHAPKHLIRPGGLTLGVIAIVLGTLFLAAADGGPGTGNGVVASVAAIVLGGIGVGIDAYRARS